MKKTLIISMVFALMLVAMPAMAQTDENNSADEFVTTSTESTGAIGTSPTSQEEDTITADDEVLEGIEVDEISSVPSSLGLWWRNVRENFSLGLTFDPVKKAEKALKFAEERMKIAELMAANSTNEKLQERAQVMIERSQALMEKVEAGQTKWASGADKQRVQRLMNNVATHQLNQERVMNRIEQRLPEQVQERFNQLREKGLEANQRLMNALSNENIPEETKAKLEAVKARIEEHASTTKAYIEMRKELHEKIQAGEEGAIEELKQLNEKRKEDLKTGLQEFKGIRDAIRATTTERLMQRMENGTASGAPMNRERVENRIMNNGTATSSMIRADIQQQTQASGTQAPRPIMPRR